MKKFKMFIFLIPVFLLSFQLIVFSKNINNQDKKEQVILKEHFADNKNKWFEGKNEFSSFEIRDNGYFFENKVDKSLMTWISVSLDKTRDFTIESKIAKFIGHNEYPYGIIWGVKDQSNYYSFGINSKGLYTIYKLENGEVKDISGWKQSANINKLEFMGNKLSIKKSGNTLKFYINDKFTDEYPFSEFYGDGIGFQTSSKMKIEIHNLFISQPKPKISKFIEMLAASIPPKVKILEPNVTSGFEIVSKKQLLKVRGIASAAKGISKVTVNGTTAKVSANGEFTVFIKLDEGHNIINVKATDNNLNTSNDNFKINYKNQKN